MKQLVLAKAGDAKITLRIARETTIRPALVIFDTVILIEDDGFRRGRPIDEMDLSFTDFGVFMDRRIDRYFAGEPELPGPQIVLQYP